MDEPGIWREEQRIRGGRRNFFLNFESARVEAARESCPADGILEESMVRPTSLRNGFQYRVWKAATLAAVLGWSAVAIAQVQPQAPQQAPVTRPKMVPDAQIEAAVLKGLAGATDLANQAITTTTVYGVVTLSGAVATEDLRTEAENIAARTAGVQKVVDEMTLGPANAATQEQGSSLAEAKNPQLQSDETIAPGQAPQGQAPIVQGSPDSNNTAPNQAAGPSYGPGAPEYRQPYNGQQAPQPGYGQQPEYGQGPYGQQQAAGQPQQGYGSPQQQPYTYVYPQQQYPVQQPVFGGQEAGQIVTVPSGAMIRIRINQTLDSSRAKAGDHFDGIVVNDVTGDGAVAIPRGAAIQGVVVDAKRSGAISGRGELSLQLTQVTLAGMTYPIVSDVWAHNGADKAVQSVNSTVAGGGIGALLGAAAGGGVGAAIGAGVGGALGLGSAAASHTGQVFIPSEGMLTFHLAQPATVATVSQQEMDRLAQGVPSAAPQQLQRRYPPGYYRPYPYPY
jgi:hypothetical protein